MLFIRQRAAQSRIWGTLVSICTMLLLAWLIVQPVVSVQAQPNATKCAPGYYCVFLPGISSKQSGDLAITGIEVTQAVQNAQNDVPLVAGRKTLLRIYTSVDGVNQPVANVKVAITANAPGTVTPLDDSPHYYSTTVPLSSSRSDYTSTLNVPLPEQWTTGTVNLTIQLDPDNQIYEGNKENNFLTRTLTFLAVPGLRVMVVPVEYTDLPSGHIYPARQNESIGEWIMRAYPISDLKVVWHAPYAFQGNLASQDDFNRLLTEITTLERTESADPSVVYYGLIPTVDGGASWFWGGLAGMGWIGMRASVGIDLSGQASQIAAHEIGHNLGMQHTPCGSVSGTDPKYPYQNGAIGQYGVDVLTGTLYDPQQARDFMSYCTPKWVSDYTYNFLMQAQLRTKADMHVSALTQSVSTRPGLYVQANLRADGAQLLPAYVLPAQTSAAPRPGAYDLALVDADGRVIEQVSVTADAAGDGENGVIAGIHEIIPLPEQPAARLRLLKDGQVLAEQTLQASQRTGMAAAAAQGLRVTSSVDGYHLAWNDNAPVMIRYRANGTGAWVTLAVDVSGGHWQVTASHLPASSGEFDVIPSALSR